MKISSKSISIKLDRIDKNIIRSLQINGRIQNNDLAREIGLSASSCLRRVRLLEEAGVIKNSLYTTNFTEPLSYQDSAFLKLPKFP